ncbi:hypothetical protein RHGRI_008068 [Rhododendron griersonianum]|uniref:Uncharacterized protein n=1 Tax=Rhododendron griersonianum TaxID=479676 RepID=A0AAV6L0H1_9ERIC|nr:hypothetical protein RHGRI_008068 [Rhododendron griersonianum]
MGEQLGLWWEPVVVVGRLPAMEEQLGLWWEPLPLVHKWVDNHNPRCPCYANFVDGFGSLQLGFGGRKARKRKFSRFGQQYQGGSKSGQPFHSYAKGGSSSSSGQGASSWVVLKIERIRLQHPLKISLNPVFRGLKINSKVGALSASSVGNRVTSLRIVVRLSEVVTRHFSLRRLQNKVVRMIFPFMMKKYVKKLRVMMRRKKAMR